jgi:autotransporter-associated beta strand protein
MKKPDRKRLVLTQSQKATRRYIITGFLTLLVCISALIVINFGVKEPSYASATFIWVGTNGNINNPSNWSPAGVPSAGHTYVFDNTGSATVVTGNPAPGVLIVVNASSKNYTISGVLSGATSVTKNGSSRLILSGANTYTGLTTVNAGILNIQNSSALGSPVNGTVVKIFARLQMQNNITVNGEDLSLNYAAAGSLENVNGINRWNGNVNLTDNAIITTTAGTLFISGVISGTWGLTKNGNGILTLSNANTHAGGTTLNAGTLNINNSSALGNIAGAFRIFGGSIDNTTGAAITTLDYSQGWGGDFTFIGTNQLDLGTGPVTMSASRQVTVNANTLIVGGIIDDDEMSLAKAGAGTLKFVNQVVTLNSLKLLGGNLISTSGTLSLADDFSNNATFTHNEGSVNFNGSAATQTIGGSSATIFNNLAFTNTFGVSPQISFGANNVTVEGILTMNNFNAVNLNNQTLILGKNQSNSGTLICTSGFLYGGTFTRWLTKPILPITHDRGYFPMGTSTGDKRPLWIGYSSPLGTVGTLSVTHIPVYPSNHVSESHLDSTWGTGTSLQGISNSTWNIAISDVTFDGNTASLRYGGQGLGVYNLAELNASLDTVCVGTFAAASNFNVPLEVNRTGLTETDLINKWHIGTSNIWSSPLPIKLLSFDAKRNGDGVNLKWSTAAEINNDFFTIEKSQDAITYSTLTTVPGSGNSSSVKNYTTTDNSPYEGTSYYRLKQTDHDGKFVYFPPKSVNFSNNKNDGRITIEKIGPNPFENSFSINFICPSQSSVDIQIMNLNGVQVFNEKINFDKGLNTYSFFDNKSLPKGAYFLNMIYNGLVTTKKLIKQ